MRQRPITDWALDPGVAHLNHGSYGGCPRAVVAAANALRTRLEAAPMTFYIRDWQRELDAARVRLAAFVGAAADRLAFVPNATSGVAIALAAAAPMLDRGDELVVTDHGYRAVRNQVDRLAAARGARVAMVTLPRPFDADAAVDAFVAGATPRTRVVVIDHVTSPTALVLPVARIVAALAARGVATIVDGAHAPGQVDLAVDALGATWYVGNNHKWCCAVKASGFVVAAPAVAARTRPLVTSHGASADHGPTNRFHAELDWAGTHDPAAYLSVPVALDEVARLGGGWPAARARNHATALAMRARLAGELAAPGAPAAPPPPDDTIGTMATVPIALPAGTPAVAVTAALVAAGWELPVFDAPGGALVRLSAHLYNEVAQLDGLARALRDLGVTGRQP